MSARRIRVSGADRRRQILDVAVPLFARRGFKGTTTRQIAARAGINEAILFRHFPHKENLYWAVLDSKCRGARGRRELQRRLRDHDDARQALAAVAEDILRRNLEDPARSRLFLYSALENHRLSHRLFRTYVRRYYEVLADYIRGRIREGRFRRVDPLLAARGFLGMVVYHFQIQEIYGARHFQSFDLRRVSRTLADLWVQGMTAHNGRRSHPARKDSRS